MDFIVGTNAPIFYAFEDMGEPFIPDVGSVQYTVLDHSGVPMTGLIDVPVTTSTSTAWITITINASKNTIATGKMFERRKVVIDFTRAGQPRRGVVSYRVVPNQLYSVEPKDVRNFIGLQEKELEDKDIDLFESYLYVAMDLETVDIDTLLSSGTTSELSVNEMIRMRAVLDVLPSIRLRMAQEETNGVTGFKRPVIKDVDAIEIAARGRYIDALGIALDSLTTNATLILLTQDADPITG